MTDSKTKAWFERRIGLRFPTKKQSGSVLGILNSHSGELWRKKYISVTTFAQFGKFCALASTTSNLSA